MTAFTYDGPTKQLTITGTDLPLAADIDYIHFAKSNCIVNAASSSATSITCTLDRNPTCGTWTPKILAKLGLIVNNAALTGSEVQCTITAATPLGALNIIGGDNITISGTNFPYTLEGNTVSIKFTDTQQTECVPQTSTTDTLVCLTSSFDEASAASQ